MTSEVAVRALGLTKKYQVSIGGDESDRILRSDLGSAFRRRGVRGGKSRTVTAVDDVSFEIGRGEAVGLLGRNGAGKSTLLRILSRVSRPSSGTADVYGSIGALLEVGTGFHPALTGRENVYLSGAILGMARREIDSRFDEIVEFAEIQPFIDTPVKRYSSGMYARLGFAVAAHLQTSVLIVDEVLSVGDIAFQAKCLARMRRLTTDGTTVLFVSHNLRAVADFCERSLLMVDGVLSADGPTSTVIREYRASLASHAVSRKEFTPIADIPMRVDGVEAEGTAVHHPGIPLRIDVDAATAVVRGPIEVILNTVVETMAGHVVIHLRSDADAASLHLSENSHHLAVEIGEPSLAPGDYWLWLRVVSVDPLNPGMWDTEHVLLTIVGESITDSLILPEHRTWQPRSQAAPSERGSMRALA